MTTNFSYRKRWFKIQWARLKFALIFSRSRAREDPPLCYVVISPRCARRIARIESLSFLLSPRIKVHRRNSSGDRARPDKTLMRCLGARASRSPQFQSWELQNPADFDTDNNYIHADRREVGSWETWLAMETKLFPFLISTEECHYLGIPHYWLLDNNDFPRREASLFTTLSPS